MLKLNDIIYVKKIKKNKWNLNNCLKLMVVLLLWILTQVEF